jgi:NAD(P)-dependent dehydrogenase (short-subunit alcohol dehydrogenase family)
MDPMERLRPPTGLRVLVTAGAAGIGRAIAEAFTAAGANVGICDVDTDALEAASDAMPAAALVEADVADESQVAMLADEMAERLGGLDVVVNNAGVAGPTDHIESIAYDDWRRTIDVNLNGQYLVAAHTVPLLKQSGGEGAMINIASVAGRLGYAYRTPYAASKWAIVGLTSSLAKELGPDGIRVNAILPGIVRGPRIERVIAARAKAVGVDYAEMERRYLEMVSLRRMVQPEDIASMALFLCTPGGRNVSGQALSVCGNVENL